LFYSLALFNSREGEKLFLIRTGSRTFGNNYVKFLTVRTLIELRARGFRADFFGKLRAGLF